MYNKAYLQATKVNMVRSAIAAFFSGLRPWKLQDNTCSVHHSQRREAKSSAETVDHLSDGTYIFARMHGRYERRCGCRITGRATLEADRACMLDNGS